MQPIIQKAIEGGWTVWWFERDYGVKYFSEYMQILLPESIECVWYTTYICDPLFWQALGKACGWDVFVTREGEERLDPNPLQQRYVIPKWLYVSLRFHEKNLTEGWENAVEYLNELVK